MNFEGGINNTGEIKIYGNKLPTIGEIVSVNYICRFYFDESINNQIIIIILKIKIYLIKFIGAQMTI